MNIPSSFFDWVSNSRKNIDDILSRDYFEYAEKPEPESWSFFDEDNPYTGIENYLDYIWKFKYYNGTIICDVPWINSCVIPDEAQLAAFNMHLRSIDGEKFYAVCRKYSKWKLTKIIRLGTNSEEERQLDLLGDKSEGPEELILRIMPQKIQFSNRINDKHLRERLIRFPRHIYENIQEQCTNNEQVRNYILRLIFGDEYDINKPNLFIKDNPKESSVSDFEPDYLIEKWFAPSLKGDSESNRLNVNTRSFIYPLCVEDDLVPDAALIFGYTNFQKGTDEEKCSFKMNTIYSLRYAFRNAVLVRKLEGMEDTWLSYDAVERTIKTGAMDKE